MGLMRMKTAAGSRTYRAARFQSRVVNGTTGKGRGRVWVTGDGMVSVLDIIQKEGDMLNECTYPEQFT
jgi:hypothetical protein